MKNNIVSLNQSRQAYLRSRFANQVHTPPERRVIVPTGRKPSLYSVRLPDGRGATVEALTVGEARGMVKRGLKIKGRLPVGTTVVEMP